MLSYPAKFERDGKGWLVTFPDFPGVFSSGVDFEDAKRHAVDALETALMFWENEGAPFPPASKLTKATSLASADGQVRRRSGLALITVSLTFTLKRMLSQELYHQRVSQVELARRLGITPQEVTRLLDLRRKTKAESIADALQALGKRLDFFLVSAA